MSWFSKIFKRQPKNSRFAGMLDGSLPVFTQFGTNIYASDVVQQALRCIVDEIKKLNPTHVRYVGNDPVPVKDVLQPVLDEPNELMTKSDFLEKTCWMLLLNDNAFVLPSYYTWTDEKTGATRRYYKALYPINPVQVDFIEDASGRLFVKFWFWDGENTTIPYDDVIHIRKNFALNEYMGGNRQGEQDNAPLLKTLELNHTLLEGVSNAMKASYSVSGVMKYTTLMDEEKMREDIQKLEEKLNRGESGIMPIDVKAEYIPIKRDTQIVDDKTLEFVDSKILRYFKVPLAILSGDYTKDQYNAFYQSTLEPIVIAFSQAFTKKLFTDRERSFGNRIELYPKDLIFMTMDQTIQMVTLLSNTGAIFENEKRAAFGLRPLPELEGKRFTSLNWIDANNADAYQLGKNVNVDIVDKNVMEV